MTFDPELSKINKNKNHENKKQNNFTGLLTTEQHWVKWWSMMSRSNRKWLRTMVRWSAHTRWLWWSPSVLGSDPGEQTHSGSFYCHRLCPPRAGWPLRKEEKFKSLIEKTFQPKRHKVHMKEEAHYHKHQSKLINQFQITTIFSLNFSWWKQPIILPSIIK